MTKHLSVNITISQGKKMGIVWCRKKLTKLTRAQLVKGTNAWIIRINGWCNLTLINSSNYFKFGLISFYTNYVHWMLFLLITELNLETIHKNYLPSRTSFTM